ncbi:hypothetical protein BKA80DRAFT_38056 [Phyllosticta citrichinensis]
MMVPYPRYASLSRSVIDNIRKLSEQPMWRHHGTSLSTHTSSTLTAYYGTISLLRPLEHSSRSTTDLQTPREAPLTPSGRLQPEHRELLDRSWRKKTNYTSFASSDRQAALDTAQRQYLHKACKRTHVKSADGRQGAANKDEKKYGNRARAAMPLASELKEIPLLCLAHPLAVQGGDGSHNTLVVVGAFA